MTTKAAEALYLAQHNYEMEGVPFAVFNPDELPIAELPVIYGFNNGGSPGWFAAVAIAQDGKVLSGHCCSNEGYMPYDLGMLKDTRLDLHEKSYQLHYPQGYRMQFISSEDLSTHEGLNAALKLALARDKEPAEALK